MATLGSVWPPSTSRGVRDITERVSKVRFIREKSLSLRCLESRMTILGNSCTATSVKALPFRRAKHTRGRCSHLSFNIDDIDGRGSTLSLKRTPSSSALLVGASETKPLPLYKNSDHIFPLDKSRASDPSTRPPIHPSIHPSMAFL